MLRHLGFVGMVVSQPGIETSRTCRLRNATPERLRELIAANLRGLEAALKFCAGRDIRMFRISSEAIPFGSHPINAVPWWEEEGETLGRIGRFLKEERIRVSMHPGQYTVLNSADPAVVDSAIKEIDWHVRMLDALGTDASSKVVLHVGGTAGGREAAMDRFAATLDRMSDAARRRIVIENDERGYSIENVLALSARTGLPVVFDNLHDRIHSGRYDGPGLFLDDVFATWRPEDGPPKLHFSSQAPGARPGAHADRIDPAEFVGFLDMTPKDRPFDVMLEVKEKDRALLILRDELRARGLGEVRGVT